MEYKLQILLNLNNSINTINDKFHLQLSLNNMLTLLVLYNNSKNLYKDLQALNIYTHRQSVNNCLELLELSGLITRKNKNSLTILGRIVVSSFLSSLE